MIISAHFLSGKNGIFIALGFCPNTTLIGENTMKTALKLVCYLVPAIALTGCAEMLQASQEARATLDKMMGYGGTTESSVSSKSVSVTNDTPSQICKTYEENEARYNALYKNKHLTAKGKIYLIGSSSVTIKSGNVLVSGIGGKDIINLKKGQNYTVSGKIYWIEYDHRGCSITLI